MKVTTIPAGINWKRTGRRTWLCTVRSEPETVYEPDYAELARLNQAAICLQFPCCGFSRPIPGDSLFGGVLGGLGL
jgi:hypothetical protein